MSGKMGMFMQVLPVMISILLLSSLFEAFYFLPLHSKEFFSIGKVERIQKKKSWFWSITIRFYQFILKWLLRVKFLSLILLIGGIIYGTLSVAKVTKFQLFPEFDVQQVFLNGKVNINNELKDTEAYVQKIEESLLKHLDEESVESVTSIIGLKMNPDQTMDIGDNLFQIFVNLYEKAPDNFFDKNINPLFSLEYDGSNMIRHKMAQEIGKEIQEDILEDMRNLTINGQKVFEEFNVYVQQTGMVSNDIEIGFSASTEEKMSRVLKRVESRLKEIDGVKDIGNNANEGERELKLRVNEYGQSLGLSEGFISKALRGSFFKAEYGKMFNQEGLVRIKIEDENKDEKGSIDNFMLTTPTGEVVVLHEVCDFFYQKSFVRTFKEDGLNVRSIYASLDKEIVLATEVMQQLQPLLETIKKEGVKVIVKGEEKENKKLKQEMVQIALIAVFLIFIALVWMFNSFIQPLIVLSIIPLSIFGVLVGTKMMGLNMTMTGMMGVVGLAGVVVNDGLIMLSFVRKGKTQEEILEYAGQRIRPIILTSVTTVLGLSTLIFFASGQALILQPMAISLGFGVAWATVLNLYFVPLMYAVIYGIKREKNIKTKEQR